MCGVSIILCDLLSLLDLAVFPVVGTAAQPRNDGTTTENNACDTNEAAGIIMMGHCTPLCCVCCV